MTVEPLTRRCARCWIEKPLDGKHFAKAASKEKGFAHHCRECGAATKRLAKRFRDYVPTEDGMAWV